MAAQPFARVVVGVDESLAGLAAVRFAVAQARCLDVAVHAVSAWVFTPPWKHPSNRRWRSEIAEEAGQCVQAVFAEAVGGTPADVTVTAAVREGVAGQVLVDYADREDDLLVLGGRRYAGRLASTGGPVARYCLRHARGPVVVVPPPMWARAASGRRLNREVDRELRRFG
jgi:nucleotide-binding universal stress UspA family protein